MQNPGTLLGTFDGKEKLKFTRKFRNLICVHKSRANLPLSALEKCGISFGTNKVGIIICFSHMWN